MTERSKSTDLEDLAAATTGALRIVEPADEPAADNAPLQRTGWSIRTKILSLVVLSALLPAALVGVVSYLTARSIQDEELSEQLSTRIEVLEEQADRYFDARVDDAEVFANSFVISESLDVWRAAPAGSDSRLALEAGERIGAYLAEVRDRYPLYRELSVYDTSGALVAGAGSTGQAEAAPAPLVQPSTEVEAELERVAGEPLFYVVQKVRNRTDDWVGSLVTASTLDGLWLDLANAQQQARGRIVVLDGDGRALFSSDLYPGTAAAEIDSEGARLALAGGFGIAEYPDQSGEQMVGAYLAGKNLGIGFLIEIASDEAFAVSHRLRDFTLLSSLLAAGLIAGLGFWVVVGLTRPIAALTSGASEASAGNLTVQIPVSSNDEIGHLSRVFNRMVSSLHESRVELQRLSNTDELTGLHNRRQLARLFEIEIERSRRTGRPLSVLMIDIDHFKSFNDTFGHLEGDALLRRLGSFLTQELRATDVLARYGGEEFIVLLPDTANKDAEQLAERLRQEFIDQRRASADPEVTLSIGIATGPGDGKTRDQLVAAADSALYDAKRDGRNRVCVAV